MDFTLDKVPDTEYWYVRVESTKKRAIIYLRPSTSMHALLVYQINNIIIDV